MLRFNTVSRLLLRNRGNLNKSYHQNHKKLSISQPDRAKVALIGAGGAIGQSLALLLKYNPLVVNLTIQDIKNVDGVAADLNHIDTSTKVFSYSGPDSVGPATANADIIVIAAGMPRKPGMTRDDLFVANADIVWNIMEQIKMPFDKRLILITNPINSLLPMITTFLKPTSQFREYEKLVYGVTTLDSVRASHYYAEYLDKDPREVHVPVIGGHSENTIVPLFSMSNFPLIEEAASSKLTELVQQGGNEVVKAKAGGGSASLSMAYAANRFINSIIESMYGKTTFECGFVSSTTHTEIEYFAEMFELDATGILKFLNFSKIPPHESRRLDAIIPILKAEIQKGIDYAHKKNPNIKKGEAVMDRSYTRNRS